MPRHERFRVVAHATAEWADERMEFLAWLCEQAGCTVHQAEALNLWCQGKSPSEAAAILGAKARKKPPISRSTFWRAFHGAKEKLRQMCRLQMETEVERKDPATGKMVTTMEPLDVEEQVEQALRDLLELFANRKTLGSGNPSASVIAVDEYRTTPERTVWQPVVARSPVVTPEDLMGGRNRVAEETVTLILQRARAEGWGPGARA